MIYAFAQLSIRDRDTLGAYRAKAAEALARHGGTVVAAGPATLLEGDAPAPDTAALLGFPDRAAALAWIQDPTLADIHALRRGSGDSRVILLA